MTIKKPFKKGDKVTVIKDWNRNGMVSVREATVHSCGTKVMRLTCDHTGEEFGRELQPRVADKGWPGVRPRLEGAELDAEAQAVAENWLQHILDHLIHCRDNVGPTAGEAYVESIQKQIDALGKPRWGFYHVLCEQIRRIAEAKHGKD